ncbi:hypothetical protein AV530_004971 [Patagioenas fasciata monilis]|uniref:Uncharacterized protein n=1 Tax=Patagioenas fasciata monilis TaxID=372326 RepID=A0A1V4K3G8_PATFA|nr:hypothetical protein AV530_004971 [Patagioenas fasciata monilis]
MLVNMGRRALCCYENNLQNLGHQCQLAPKSAGNAQMLDALTAHVHTPIADAIIINLAFSNTLTLLNGIINILFLSGNGSNDTCFTTPVMARAPDSDMGLSGCAFAMNFSSNTILMYEKQYTITALRCPRSQSRILGFRRRGFTCSRCSGSETEKWVSMKVIIQQGEGTEAAMWDRI